MGLKRYDQKRKNLDEYEQLGRKEDVAIVYRAMRDGAGLGDRADRIEEVPPEAREKTDAQEGSETIEHSNQEKTVWSKTVGRLTDFLK